MKKEKETKISKISKTMYCQRCGAELPVGKRKWCFDCGEIKKAECHNEQSKKYYAKHLDEIRKKYYAKSGKNVPPLPKQTLKGITFEFIGGGWFWELNGLRNGPFRSMASARKDAREAFY